MQTTLQGLIQSTLTSWNTTFVNPCACQHSCVHISCRTSKIYRVFRFTPLKLSDISFPNKHSSLGLYLTSQRPPHKWTLHISDMFPVKFILANGKNTDSQISLSLSRSLSSGRLRANSNSTGSNIQSHTICASAIDPVKPVSATQADASLRWQGLQTGIHHQTACWHVSLSNHDTTFTQQHAVCIHPHCHSTACLLLTSFIDNNSEKPKLSSPVCIHRHCHSTACLLLTYINSNSKKPKLCSPLCIYWHCH